jgi:hypothetical protein
VVRDSASIFGGFSAGLVDAISLSGHRRTLGLYGLWKRPVPQGSRLYSDGRSYRDITSKAGNMVRLKPHPSEGRL